MAKDFYETLGVPRTADAKAIRQAYRKLARKYHPDVNPNDRAAEQRFKEATAAFEVLSDKEKRARYDRYHARFGDQWERGEEIEKAQQQAGRWSTVGSERGAGRGGLGDLGDLFGDAGGGFFDSLLRRARRPSRRRGENVEHHTTVTLEEAFAGTTRVLSIESEEPCPACSGAGRIGQAICYSCQGAGVVTRPRRIEVKIPAGVDTDSRVRVAGEGRPGAGGAPAGDLVLVVSVRPHPRFERKGDDLHIEVPVSLLDAVLGSEAQLQTIKGSGLLKVPPLTQNGRVFRLQGQGMPRLNGSGRGDLYAKVRVLLPEALTDEERSLYEKLRALGASQRQAV